MSLFVLNTSESKDIGKGPVCANNQQRYQTDLGVEGDLQIYTMALNEIIDKTSIALIVCHQMKQCTEEETLELKKDFSVAILRAKEVLQAFIKDCASVDSKIEYIDYLRDRFIIIANKVNLFYLSCNEKYGEEVMTLSKLLLDVFKNCAANSVSKNLAKSEHDSDHAIFSRVVETDEDFGVKDIIIK